MYGIALKIDHMTLTHERGIELNWKHETCPREVREMYVSKALGMDPKGFQSDRRWVHRIMGSSYWTQRGFSRTDDGPKENVAL